jgi:hypothetical protein
LPHSQDTPTPQLIILLLSDIALLLAPRAVTDFSSASSFETHHNRTPLRAVSDLVRLIWKEKEARMKALLYVALLRDALPVIVMKGLAEQVEKEREKREREEETRTEHQGDVQWLRERELRIEQPVQGPKIVEIA